MINVKNLLPNLVLLIFLTLSIILAILLIISISTDKIKTGTISHITRITILSFAIIILIIISASIAILVYKNSNSYIDKIVANYKKDIEDQYDQELCRQQKYMNTLLSKQKEVLDQQNLDLQKKYLGLIDKQEIKQEI